MQNLRTLGQPLLGEKYFAEKRKKNNHQNSGHFVQLQRLLSHTHQDSKVVRLQDWLLLMFSLPYTPPPPPLNIHNYSHPVHIHILLLSVYGFFNEILCIINILGNYFATNTFQVISFYNFIKFLRNITPRVST